MDKHGVTVDDFKYFLPHISSMFFRKPTYRSLKAAGIEIPYDKWVVNLPEIGNIGSASAFLIMEELLNSGRLKKDEHLMVMVPESARFSYAFMYLTVV